MPAFRLAQWMEKVRKEEERKLLELERQLEQELLLDIRREEVLTEEEQQDYENSEEDQLSQEEEMVQGLRSLKDNFPAEDVKQRIHDDDIVVIDPKFGKRSLSSHLPWQLAQSTETQDPMKRSSLKFWKRFVPGTKGTHLWTPGYPSKKNTIPMIG